MTLGFSVIFHCLILFFIFFLFFLLLNNYCKICAHQSARLFPLKHCPCSFTNDSMTNIYVLIYKQTVLCFILWIKRRSFTIFIAKQIYFYVCVVWRRMFLWCHELTFVFNNFNMVCAGRQPYCLLFLLSLLQDSFLIITALKNSAYPSPRLSTGVYLLVFFYSFHEKEWNKSAEYTQVLVQGVGSFEIPWKKSQCTLDSWTAGNCGTYTVRSNLVDVQHNSCWNWVENKSSFMTSKKHPLSLCSCKNMSAVYRKLKIVVFVFSLL